jgi:hypothetical protein
MFTSPRRLVIPMLLGVFLLAWGTIRTRPVDAWESGSQEIGDRRGTVSMVVGTANLDARLPKLQAAAGTGKGFGIVWNRRIDLTIACERRISLLAFDTTDQLSFALVRDSCHQLSTMVRTFIL